ncbi:MAG: bifunctional adenosylcobinamide kinase/adenosylcobinamide-phosphate guanylyltransferase [Acinetobacter populi]|jgi:adenosylcobinamide kinase/adenosylcobinamide-phosphate guanylyltransferase|uniref:bifunctional adenosylcobinamide kinase/adenosylcobinamide-phosphate guanylyltransferase n=1 Tax=Acinetobacter populi TaxID=1582270 RepID=UPI002354BBFF|nr:bifunctional adenosylcobinamide kinase/adenosylcobinamide-phosphate guanylyltransferase [Acinetobacter populi]MCH4248827.1 bifunctional adenosylcobinamide kinase/adenosylcobinamide-phosphate guanylyltransferase [Acinetobacter populi]
MGMELILGGARSGKSKLAEQRAKDSALPVLYVATAQALDAEMQLRIQHHQQTRPATWQLVEEPIDLADVLLQHDQSQRLILVDCLTLWLSNVLTQNEALFRQQIDSFLEVAAKLEAQLILVSNETGLGVVPMGELSRKFVDESGRLHQKLAQLADRVTFCVAGLPMTLKG